VGEEAPGDMPGSATDGSPLDVSIALRQAGGDVTLLIELVGIFLEDLPERVRGLERAIRGRDTGDLSFIAHAIRGALAGLGATPAGTLARELEALAEEGRLDEAAERFRRLTRELERLTAFLADSRWRERLSGS
jgi:HPt (histidine-containing phosphotransfer) domain-containing protein